MGELPRRPLAVPYQTEDTACHCLTHKPHWEGFRLLLEGSLAWPLNPPLQKIWLSGIVESEMEKAY